MTRLGVAAATALAVALSCGPTPARAQDAPAYREATDAERAKAKNLANQVARKLLETRGVRVGAGSGIEMRFERVVVVCLEYPTPVQALKAMGTWPAQAGPRCDGVFGIRRGIVVGLLPSRAPAIAKALRAALGDQPPIDGVWLCGTDQEGWASIVRFAEGFGAPPTPDQEQRKTSQGALLVGGLDPRARGQAKGHLRAVLEKLRLWRSRPSGPDPTTHTLEVASMATGVALTPEHLALQLKVVPIEEAGTAGVRKGRLVMDDLTYVEMLMAVEDAFGLVDIPHDQRERMMSWTLEQIFAWARTGGRG